MQDNSKDHLRRTIKRDRISLTENERFMAEQRINSFVTRCYEATSQGTSAVERSAIGFYAATQGEVSLSRSAQSLWQAGERIAFPRVLCKETMAFYAIEAWTDLLPGAFGILEPPQSDPPVLLHELTHVFVPGVAFSKAGGRIGYGGGYYDRYLAAAPEHLVVVGVAFSFQLVDSLPMLVHDKRMHYVITEQGVIDCQTGRLQLS